MSDVSGNAPPHEVADVGDGSHDARMLRRAGGPLVTEARPPEGHAPRILGAPPHNVPLAVRSMCGARCQSFAACGARRRGAGQDVTVDLLLSWRFALTSQVATAGGARARSDLIDVLGLSEPERRALLARTHALESKIFRSVEPFETYLARVLDAHAAGVWVWTLVASDDALVGYNVITYHEYERADGPIGVYRANVGLLPEYRNHNRTVATGLRLAIPRLLRDGRRRYFFHAYLLHPSVYVMLDKFSTVIWPSARNDPPPAAALDLLAFFARQPGAPPPWEGAEPWVVKLPTAVAERDDELDAWRRSDRPSAKYYFERNPHSREGGALVMLVPLTLDNLGRAVVRLLRQKASRGWRR